MESIFSKPEIIWFMVGLVLFLLELVLPGFVIFFFGIGAWVTALICLLTGTGFNVNWQIVVFLVVSVATLLSFRKIIQKKFFYNKDEKSDSIEDEFTGREAVAIADFGTDRKGKVEFKGTQWKAESESDIKAGQTVIIIEKENFKLIVQPKI